MAEITADILALWQELTAAATAAPWAVSPESTAEFHRKMFGEANCPDGVKIIERPPQSRQEAMETFFEAVVVGWMSDEDAAFVAAARTAMPALLLLARARAWHRDGVTVPIAVTQDRYDNLLAHVKALEGRLSAEQDAHDRALQSERKRAVRMVIALEAECEGLREEIARFHDILSQIRHHMEAGELMGNAASALHLIVVQELEDGHE